MSISKEALDPVAEEYWTEYYKDLGYGEDFVRKLPRRIATSLVGRYAEQGVSCSAPKVEILSVTAGQGENTLVEGTYRARQSDAGRTAAARNVECVFCAEVLPNGRLANLTWK